MWKKKIKKLETRDTDARYDIKSNLAVFSEFALSSGFDLYSNLD